MCVPRGADGVRWNTTFEAFADFWGFEPRLCRAYRAQTKGKVESGVKYFKRNFLAGRRFRDYLDFTEQLQEWTATVAYVRVHGTTHERPIDRFARKRDGLVPAVAGRAFRLEAPLTRVVATDYLVTVDTNRYSVPFTLIGQPRTGVGAGGSEYATIDRDSTAACAPLGRATYSWSGNSTVSAATSLIWSSCRMTSRSWVLCTVRQ